MNNNTDNNGREVIQAARSYKLSEEEKPKEEVVEEVVEKPVEPEVKIQVVTKKSPFGKILLFLLILLGIYTFYSTYNYNNTIELMKRNTSPISTIGEEKELDINSSVVLDLYNKVKTNIREDMAETELNSSMKFYLAFRQIPSTELFESDCDGFDSSYMTPYTCPSNFKPNAFKKESIKIQYEKLFGEDSNFTYQNIQIGRNCTGGYEYIESRGEYVQGYCGEAIASTIKTTKELVSAKSYESFIILKENVKYISTDGATLPENLKSGTYIYTFKLDNNYNYIYVSKELEEV